MSAKTFPIVFEKISFSKTIQSAFCNSIVENIIIHKKQKNVEIHLTSDEILEHDMIQQLQQELLKQLPGVKEVNVTPFFNIQQKFSEKEIIEKCWENVVYEISSESPICKGIIKEAYWELEQKKLLIYVKNNTAYYMYKKGIEQKIQKYFQQQTGLDIRVVFQDIRLSEEQKQE